MRTRRNLFETLENRWLLSANWGIDETLIGQDTAAANYPSIDGTGGSIAVIDTGVDAAHPNLSGKILTGYNFADNNTDTSDANGHGTFMAGLIAASGFTFSGGVYNNNYFQGVAPSAKIIPLKVADGALINASQTAIKSALDWVIANRVADNIVAVTLPNGAGNHQTSSNDPNYSSEMATLMSEGVFIATGTGDDGFDYPDGVVDPACDSSAIAIGASTSTHTVPYFSQAGPLTDLMTAAGDSVPVLNNFGAFGQTYGTSLAAAIAAGAAALIKQINPGATVAQMLSDMQSSGVTDFDVTLNTNYIQLNLNTMIQSAIAQAPVGVSGTYNSSAYDSGGNLYLSWYNNTASFLMYATRSGGHWSTDSVIDSSTTDVGKYDSLALDNNSLPGVAYFDKADNTLRYAHLSGSTWTIQTADQLSGGIVGQFTSLGFNNNNTPGIAYLDRTNSDLKFARYVPSSGTWSPTVVDSTSGSGKNTSLVWDAPLTAWELSYTTALSGGGSSVNMAFKPQSSGWSTSTVATLSGATGATSANYLNLGLEVISYYDAANDSLDLASWTGILWLNTTLATNGGGYNTELVGTGLLGLRFAADNVYYSDVANSLEITGNSSGVLGSGGTFESAAVNNGSTYTAIYLPVAGGNLAIVDGSL